MCDDDVRCSGLLDVIGKDIVKSFDVLPVVAPAYSGERFFRAGQARTPDGRTQDGLKELLEIHGMPDVLVLDSG
jgi:hypothetical protein